MTEPSDPVASLWRFDGTVSRQTYALVGFIGFAIKHNIDRVIARDYLYGINGLLNYWAPLNKAARLAHLSYTEKQFLFKLVIVSLPFIYVGVNLTVRRLRDAALPLWLLLSIGLTTIIGLVCLSLSTRVLGSYGWSLFIALPFCMGLFAVLLHSYHEPRSFESCLEVAIMPIIILAAILLAIAVEGIICLMMAAPMALFLALLGGSIGFVIQLHYWDTHFKPAVLTAILFLLPAAFFGEHAAALKPPDFVVHSAVEINAPPEAVWRQVIAFTEIPPPQELLFRAGVAYPIRAEISGSGVGAIRLCIFSTGPFEEPITVWDEPHLLKFRVNKNPAPLNELSPYKNIHAPHLHGYFISHGGQFLLTALPGGRTHLEGTTWYQHTMWPATYWSWWSNYVIHRIHLRVLNHIRDRAESQTIQAVATAADSKTR
jgi:uncharacterized membrane protein YhaH (DUF805 family)